MPQVTETNVYALAAAHQTAAGAPAAAPTKRFLQVAGDFSATPDYGSEQWSTGSRFGGTTDWVNSVLGNGAPGIEADTDSLAYLLWLFTGAETVAANAEEAALNDHVYVPAVSAGPYSTWWKKIGQTQPQRQKYADCRLGQVQIEASTANKAVRISPTALSLDPAINLTADPVWPALPNPSDVMLYTEGAGAFEIDGIVFRGQSQFTIVLNEDLSARFTDDINPYAVQSGNPAATIAVTIEADADGIAEYNRLVYGTATPANLAKPQKHVPALGSYEFAMEKRDAAGVLVGGFKFEMPGTRWTPPPYPGPSPTGGEATLALAGSMRPVSGSPEWRCTVTNSKAAYSA